MSPVRGSGSPELPRLPTKGRDQKTNARAPRPWHPEDQPAPGRASKAPRNWQSLLLTFTSFFLVQKFAEITHAHVSSASGNHNVDLRAFCLRTCAGKVCADVFGTFRHSTHSPMTICLAGELWRCVKAPPIVATGHSKLTLVIIELEVDLRSPGVAEGIR